MNADKKIEIDEIINNSIDISKITEKYYLNNKIPSDLILFSLRAAMEAFFSLHSSYISKNIFKFDDLYNYEKSFVYIDLYFRAIIHFQQFFELTIKEIIRKKDESLILTKNKKRTKPFSEILPCLKEQYSNKNIQGKNVKTLIKGE